jgi:hypothetical protein
MRRATTTLRKVTAHGGHVGNDTADALAALGAAGKGDLGGQARLCALCGWIELYSIPSTGESLSRETQRLWPRARCGMAVPSK